MSPMSWDFTQWFRLFMYIFVASKAFTPTVHSQSLHPGGPLVSEQR